MVDNGGCFWSIYVTNQDFGLVGSSLKIAVWLPLPCDTWHRSFHSDISHPEFFPVDIPPGYLPSGILLRRHSTRISHIRNSIRPTFHLFRIFRSRRLLPVERGGRFNFPGQTCPDPLVTLTRTAWLVRHSRFAGYISAHNKKAPTILTIKSPELTLIFNAR